MLEVADIVVGRQVGEAVVDAILGSSSATSVLNKKSFGRLPPLIRRCNLCPAFATAFAITNLIQDEKGKKGYSIFFRRLSSKWEMSVVVQFLS
jgi:hypothetical protein